MMAVTPPVLVYNFEDPSAGTTVANSGSGGATYAGTLEGDVLPTFSTTGASPAGGQFMHFESTEATPGATFQNTGGRVDSAALLNPILGGTGTVASYMRTTQIGNGDAWQSPGVTGAEQAGAGDDIFWSNIDPTDRVRMRAGDGGIAISSNSIGDGAWHHVVSTRNKDTGLQRVYVDGILRGSATGDLGQKGANFRAIGATTDVAANLTDVQGYNYLTGDLDKVEIYGSALTPQEIATLYAVPTTAVPAAPAGITGTSTGPGSNRLSIPAAPAAQGVAGYVILAGNSAAGPFSEIGIVGSNGTNPTTFVDRSVTPGQAKFYVVRAFNSTGTSADSAPAVSVTTATSGEGATGQYFNDSWWGGGTSLENGASTVLVLRVGAGDVRQSVGNIDFDYGGGSPSPLIRGDQHSTAFTGRIVLPTDANGNGTAGESVDIQFVSNTDDDGYLFVEDDTGAQVLASTDPGGHGQRDATTLQTVTITEGKSYDFVLLQHEGGGGSGVHLRWDNPATGTRETVPESMLQTDMDTTEAGGLKRPTALAATDTTDTNVTFSFTDASSNETRFELLRSAGATFNAANAVVVGTAGINAAEIRDAQVIAGTWSYALQARNVNGVSPLSTPLNNVTVAAHTATNGAAAYYFNSSAWNGGRIANFAGQGPEGTRVLAGAPDLAALVETIDVDFASTADAPDPLINTDFFGTLYTGKVLIPLDFNGNGTSGETIQVQFVGNTDDHGFYFVNGQLAAQANYPRGQGDYTDAGPTTLVEGQKYDFVILQEEIGGGAGVHFKWRNAANPDDATNIEVIPTDNLFVGTGAPAAPGAPTGIGLGNIVVLSWADNATNEVSYLVERAGSAAGPFTTVAVLPINSTGYSDSTTTPNTNYVYRVTAVNYEGRGSTNSAVINSGAPTAPLAPVITTGVARVAGPRIGFTDNSNNEQSFIVQRRLASEPDTAFAQVGTVGATAPGTFGSTLYFQDTTASVGQNYVYRVVASNAVADTPSANFTLANTPSNGTGLNARYYDDYLNTRDQFDPTLGFLFRDPIGAVETFGGGAIGPDGLGGGGGNNGPVGVDAATGDPVALDAETFSGLFTGFFVPDTTGAYTFRSNSDDGVSFQLLDPDTQAVLVDFDGSGFLRGMGAGFADVDGTVSLVAGKAYQIIASFAENGGGAGFRFGYSSAATGTEAIPTELLFPTRPVSGGAKVSQVFVNGTGITGQLSANGIAFRALAGIDNTYGYPVPGANQLKSIPWSNGINKIALRFTEDVGATLGQDDLVVHGINTLNYAVSGFTYDAATKTGTWTLATAITNDKVRLFVDDAGVTGLDGEWTTAQAYPSGNGTAGGDFSFRVNVLRGDANQDGSVSALDLGQLKAKLNKNATTNQGTGAGAYSVFVDLNADGQINALDLGVAKARLNNKLPLGEPAATSLLFSSRPISR